MTELTGQLCQEWVGKLLVVRPWLLQNAFMIGYSVTRQKLILDSLAFGSLLPFFFLVDWLQEKLGLAIALGISILGRELINRIPKAAHL